MNPSETVTTAQINDLEDRRYAAMVDADLDTLDDLLADDVIYTHSDASVDTKTSYLDMLRSGSWCTWPSSTRQTSCSSGRGWRSSRARCRARSGCTAPRKP